MELTYKKITVIAAAATILMLVVTPVAAITYGEPDGDRHPNVGLILADRNGDGTLDLTCSGTLVAPTVFLTAGHCTSGFALSGIQGWVTFDPEFDPQTSELIPIAAFITNPDFNPSTVVNDVGVLILAEPVPGVTPAALAPENLLDQMKDTGALKDQAFVNVGYGATAKFKGMPPAFSRDGIRRFAISPHAGLTPNNLHLLTNNDAKPGFPSWRCTLVKSCGAMPRDGRPADGSGSEWPGWRHAPNPMKPSFVTGDE